MPPITLLDRLVDRTTDQLLEQLTSDAYHGAAVQIWLYEDHAKRAAMEATLKERGITARGRSAYKPLVHFFLEEVETASLTAAEIICPQHSACVPERFLLEAYPLADLFPDVRIGFTKAKGTNASASDDNVTAPPSDQASTYYRVTLHFGARHEHHRVFAPNILATDFLGKTIYTLTAWLKVRHADDTISEPLKSDYLYCHEAVLTAIKNYDWDRDQPYFEPLTRRSTEMRLYLHTRFKCKRLWRHARRGGCVAYIVCVYL